MTDPEFPHGERSRSAPLLVGRAREQALLRAHLTAALAGRGSFVLIGGEAGIGKTALAEALLEAATAGALVLVGRCYDLTETPPYGPWAELLARALRCPDSRHVPRCSGRTARMGARAAGDALRPRPGLPAGVAAVRPLVLLLDDLHWADPACLDLLRFLARDLAGPRSSCSPPTAPTSCTAATRSPRSCRPWCARRAPRGSTCAR